MSELNYSDDPVFWKLRNIEDSYWNEYIATRPIYSNSFFSRIYTYHRQHGQPFNTAIDIGAGPGQAAETLAQSFDHVVLSDNDPVSIAFARRRLKHLPTKKLSYLLTTGENVLSHCKPGSMNMVTVAECIPLMDIKLILQNFHTLMQPSGTLAVWFYGPPHFVAEEKFQSQATLPSGYDYTVCQELLHRIMDTSFRPMVSGSGPERQSNWKRAADGLHSWLDYIKFEPGMWKDVRRHKWNQQYKLPFFSEAACDFPVEPISRVSQQDICSEECDETFWQVSWDITQLRRFVRASFPTPKDVEGDNEAMDTLYQQLQEAMGGVGAKRKFSWPVVLLLASANHDKRG